MTKLSQQNLLIVLLLPIAFIGVINALSCMPCGERKCTEPENCKGGLVTGVCGCCHVCAKVEGQECGGPWKIKGTCDKGLYCTATGYQDVGTCKKEVRGIERCPPLPHWFHTKLLSKNCELKQTIFCDSNCQHCCVNSHSCNPNMYKYKPGTECKMENEEIPQLENSLTPEAMKRAKRGQAVGY